MFTGIISNLGIVEDVLVGQDSDLVLILRLNNIANRQLQIGCSISCNGICLTLVKIDVIGESYLLHFQASKETGDKTTIHSWKKGDLINIEFAMRLGDELGGHMVLGHIDGLSKITQIEKSKESWIFTFDNPASITKFISKKGSITINGVSLTVNHLLKDSFVVNIIPHTFENTNFHKLSVGDLVNIEYDIIARYLDQLLAKHDK